VHISFFKIYLKDVVEHLALKYHQTARGLEGIVAKKAKKSTAVLLERFKDISKTVEQNPSNIEKLVELKEFMNSLPAELEKIKKDIEESNKIYELLEDFRYLLGPDDLRKRFTVMVKPKGIME
jgi:dynein heavy chain